MLPSGMHNLVNLLLLDIRETCLQEMPRGISKLKGYNGTIFPNWVADSSYQNMTIVGFDQLKSVGMEFYKNKGHHSSLCITPFPSLETLAFVDMASWEEWHLPDSKTFPQLRKLEIRDCPMLKGEMRNQLPSLKSLYIKGLDQLRSIGEEFYKNEGDHHSSHIALFPSLETLVFDSMPCWEEWHVPESETFPQLRNLEITNCPMLKEEMRNQLPSLKSLLIRGLDQVWHVSESETFPQLRKLQIRDCPMLKEEMLNQVFFRIVSSLSDVSKVRKLRIGDEIYPQMKTMNLDGDSLSVRGCESVRESALKAMMSMNHLSCLQEMDISRCSSHVSFLGNCFPKSLQKLENRRCRKVEFPQRNASISWGPKKKEAWEGLKETVLLSSSDSCLYSWWMNVTLGGSLAQRSSLYQTGRIEGFDAPWAISAMAFMN
ncbi:hypothetical protein AHAS_Ahas02G0085800 [Arachis hypogaea]